MNPIEKTFNLSIFLLKNKTNFKNYLNEDAIVYKKRYLDLEGMNKDHKYVSSGIIMIFEKPLNPPSWLGEINNLSCSKTPLIFPQQYNYLSIVFIKLMNNQVFAVTYGRVTGILKEDDIVSDFGLNVGKKLVDSKQLKAITLQAFDVEFTRTRKTSFHQLNEGRIITSFEIMEINSFTGEGKIKDKPFLFTSSKGLKIKGRMQSILDIGSILYALYEVYEENDEGNFNLPDQLEQLTDKAIETKLTEKLWNKIELSLKKSTKIDGRKLRDMRIVPLFPVSMESIRGFRISSLGYSKKREFEVIDIVDLFERIQNRENNLNQEELKKKFNNIKISITDIHTTEEYEISLFNSLFIEIQLKEEKYFLYQGVWYRVKHDFYHQITNVINNIKQDLPLKYIPYKSKKHNSENEYNEELARHNQVLKLDCTRYKPSDSIRKSIDLHHASNIELADLFQIKGNTLQFIHIKRDGGNASQIIHLFSQAKALGHVYLRDRDNVYEFIKNEIENQNKSKDYNVPNIDLSKVYDLQVIIVIIKENIKSNISSNFTLLERILLYETDSILKSLGLELSINFVIST